MHAENYSALQFIKQKLHYSLCNGWNNNRQNKIKSPQSAIANVHEGEFPSTFQSVCEVSSYVD